MATWIVGMFGAYLVYLFWTQDSVLYHPEQPSGMRRPMDIPPQARLGSPSMREPPLPFKTIYIKTEDDVRLHAWLIHAQDEATRKVAPTLVYLHGNAGSESMERRNSFSLRCSCILPGLTALAAGSPPNALLKPNPQTWRSDCQTWRSCTLRAKAQSTC
jgi:hypothetical protein